jgi:TRAP-type C4-dicarboxylate transport system substrate-binding protein
MTMIRRLVSKASALALAFAAFSSQAQIRWDLPSAYPETSHHVQNLQQFVADVDKATRGKLKITVYPNASLFKAPEIKSAVQNGQVKIGEVMLANFANEWQIFGIDSIPALAESYPQAMKLYQATKPVLVPKLSTQGVMLLYTVPWPPQGIYTKSPITSLTALKGLAWRAQSPATSRIAELVGASPVTLQTAELPQAVANGLVDAFMSSCSTGYDAKVYPSMKVWTNVQAWLPKNAVVVNKQAFDALDSNTQAAVLKASAEAETRGWLVSQARNNECIELMKRQGMAIVEPSARLKLDLKRVGDTMLQEWLQKTGPEGQALVDSYWRL